jgi:hypothetical protein
MIRGFKSVALGDSVLEGLKRPILEFNYLSATQADQMVMMPSFRNRLISGLSVTKFPLGRQAETGEELQSAINRYIADFGIRFDDLGVNLGKAPMPRRIQEDIEDFFPGFGRLQPFL